MEKNRTEQVVCTTLLASSRPGVALLTHSHGSVLVAPFAAYEGTATSAAGFVGVDGDIAPRVRTFPSGTPTWSPPV